MGIKPTQAFAGAKMDYTIGKGLNYNGGIIRQITAFVPHLRRWLRLGRAGEKKGWIDEPYLNAKILTTLDHIFFN